MYGAEKIIGYFSRDMYRLAFQFDLALGIFVAIIGVILLLRPGRVLERVDFIVGNDGVPRILEGNSLPGNTDHSLVPKAARQGGISMEKMCSTLVYAAMKRSGVTTALPSPASRFKSLLNITSAVADTVLNTAALLLGLVLGYAGLTFNRAPLAESSLVAGGILLVIFALFRQFDRKKEKKS